jgi:exonuclease SbcC
MILDRLTFRGLTRFVDPVSIDFKALGAGLIAVVGRNGSGKTTILEAVPAALYKTMPSRPGSLYEHCQGRDAYVQVEFDAGPAPLKVRVLVDAEQRKTEGYVFEYDRSLTTGRAAEFDALILERFGSLELFLSSVFASQNKVGDFLRMPKSARKALFAELLGLGRLEDLHELAKVRLVLSDRDLVAVRAELQEAEREMEAIDKLEAEGVQAAVKCDETGKALETAREKERACQEAVARHKGETERLLALEAAVKTSQAHQEAAEKARVAARARPVAIQFDYDKRVTELDEREKHAKEVLAMDAIVAEAEAKVPKLEAQAARLDKEEKDLAERKRDVQAALQKLNHANDRLAVQKQQRADVARRAGLLALAPCTDADAWIPSFGIRVAHMEPALLPAECPLLADARDARTAAVASAQDHALEHQAELCTQDLTKAKEALTAIEEIIAAEPESLWDVNKLLTATRKLAAQRDRLQDAARSLEFIAGERRGVKEKLDADFEEAKQRYDEAAADARRADTALGKRKEDYDLAQQQAKGDSAAPGNLRAATVAREKAEIEAKAADRAAAEIGARLDQLRKTADAIPDLKTDVTMAEEHLGDWRLLEEAFGRNGIQALEISAAGPEVAALTNELLEGCYGARFSLAFDTLREKKSARGEFAETFDVKVYDEGIERSAEALSGGERTVVGEAIGLAIAIYNARKSGIRWDTLFRDETAGALDPANAQAYVDMLRRALTMGGFWQVIFVSHSPEVWERADVRLHVGDGKVEVGA